MGSCLATFRNQIQEEGDTRLKVEGKMKTDFRDNVLTI